MMRQMNLYDETDVDIEKLRQSVVNELNREESWLMVLDNVDEVDLLKTILPEKRGNRHILITARDREMCSELRAEEIHLDVMNNIEAKYLLLEIYLIDKMKEKLNSNILKNDVASADSRAEIPSLSHYISSYLSSSDL